MANSEAHPTLASPDLLSFRLVSQPRNLGSVFLASDPASVPAGATVTVTLSCYEPTMCQASSEVASKSESQSLSSQTHREQSDFFGRNPQNCSRHETGPRCLNACGMGRNDPSSDLGGLMTATQNITGLRTLSTQNVGGGAARGLLGMSGDTGQHGTGREEGKRGRRSLTVQSPSGFGV